MSLRIRLRKTRMQSGLTQKKLAEVVGTSQQVIHRIEAGIMKSSRRITQMAEALNVCPLWLANGPGSEPIKKINGNNNDRQAPDNEVDSPDPDKEG